MNWLIRNHPYLSLESDMFEDVRIQLEGSCCRNYLGELLDSTVIGSGFNRSSSLAISLDSNARLSLDVVDFALNSKDQVYGLSAN